MSVKWDTSTLVKKVNALSERNTKRAALYLVGRVRASFGSPPMEPAKRGGFKRNSSKAWKRAHPSAPGETPHIQTGKLKTSISYDMKGAAAKVGSMLKPQNNVLTIDAMGIERTRKGSLHSYAWYLEHGTSRMAARPYLRRALFNNQSTIRRILTAP